MKYNILQLLLIHNGVLSIDVDEKAIKPIRITTSENSQDIALSLDHAKCIIKGLQIAIDNLESEI